MVEYNSIFQVVCMNIKYLFLKEDNKKKYTLLARLIAVLRDMVALGEGSDE